VHFDAVGRAIEPGETAQPGRALLIIADTRELEMTLFAPVRDLEVIQSGQPVAVRVPSLPGNSYAGRVSFIAQEGEFKPANIYNSQERSEMVFAVKVKIPNDGRLKPGLPADAVFQ
jgi:HlyD family secretion protein